MTVYRLPAPNQSYFLALEAAFDDPATPTVAELNATNFVFPITCALVDGQTELTMGDSETDDTRSVCDVGNVVRPTLPNVTGQITWFMDANTGGSGSTVDLTSLYNQVTALLGAPGIPYWFISRTGPENSQDIAWVVGHKVKMAKFETDYPITVIESNVSVRGQNTLIFQGDVNWNYTVAA